MRKSGEVLYLFPGSIVKFHITPRNKKQKASSSLIFGKNRYGLRISYSTVLGIIRDFSEAIGDMAKASVAVCPSNLRKEIFTVAALDNLDHNPSSRTATTSFHGTGISIFQFPTQQQPGLVQETINIRRGSKRSADGNLLPSSYTFVPPINRTLCVQPSAMATGRQNCANTVQEDKKHKDEWMQLVHEHLADDWDSGDPSPIMWSAYHANRLAGIGESMKCIEALLPLFHKKAASPSMIHHGMELVRKTIEHLIIPT